MTVPAAGSTDRHALGQLVRERIESALDDVVGDQPGDSPGDALLVGPYSLTTPCPLQLVHPADDYVEQTSTVRRRLGLLALRRASELDGERTRGSEPDLARAVDEVLQEREGWPTGLGRWFGELGRAGRSTVRAAVLTWCVDVTRLVGGAARSGAARRIRWTDPFMPQRVDQAGRRVRLRGGADAVLGGRTEGEKLLLVTDAAPGAADRLRAGHLAVVHSLASGRAPLRVTLGSPATGRLSPQPVDESLLELAADRIVEVVGYLADPERASARPGPWCRYCHLLDDCAEGAAEVRPTHRE